MKVLNKKIFISYFISVVILFSTVCISYSQINQDIRKSNMKDLAYRDAVKYLKDDWGKDADWAIESNIQDFRIKSAFGDIDGDKVEEAAIWATYHMGGSGSVNRVFIYKFKDELPNFIYTISYGDRAHDGIKSIKISKGLLLVTSYLPNEDDCMACYSSKTATTKFKLKNDNLINVGRSLNAPAKKKRKRTRRRKRT